MMDWFIKNSRAVKGFTLKEVSDIVRYSHVARDDACPTREHFIKGDQDAGMMPG